MLQKSLIILVFTLSSKVFTQNTSSLYPAQNVFHKYISKPQEEALEITLKPLNKDAPSKVRLSLNLLRNKNVIKNEKKVFFFPTYKVVDNNNKFIGIYGDIKTESIMFDKSAVYYLNSKLLIRANHTDKRLELKPKEKEETEDKDSHAIFDFLNNQLSLQANTSSFKDKTIEKTAHKFSFLIEVNKHNGRNAVHPIRALVGPSVTFDNFSAQWDNMSLKLNYRFIYGVTARFTLREHLKY